MIASPSLSSCYLKKRVADDLHNFWYYLTFSLCDSFSFLAQQYGATFKADTMDKIKDPNVAINICYVSIKDCSFYFLLIQFYIGNKNRTVRKKYIKLQYIGIELSNFSHEA